MGINPASSEYKAYKLKLINGYFKSHPFNVHSSHTCLYSGGLHNEYIGYRFSRFFNQCIL